MQAKECCRLFR